MQRSYCGLIDLKSVEETLVIKGWVNTRRDHGGVIFIDLRDHTGLVQVVFNPEESEIFEAAQAIRSEYVLEVCGIVKKVLFNEWYRRLVLDSKVLAGMRLISKQKNLIQKKRKNKICKDLIVVSLI